MKAATKKMGFSDGYKTYDTSKGFGGKRKWQEAFNQRMFTAEELKEIVGMNDTPHSILGVAANATEKEIKSAYRKLMHKWHPDKNPNNADAEAKSKKIIAAYLSLIK